MIMGLLPDIAAEYGVTIPVAGLLVTGYALGVVLGAPVLTVLGFGGVFAAITYIAPMMTHVAGHADGSVTWLLVLFGVGVFLGNLLGGRFANRALMPLLYTALGGLAIVLALFTVTAHNKILAAITILLVGALGFATVPPLQKRVLDQAHGAPTLASAVNIGAFNLGNALAAWLGAALAAAALLLALWSAALERRAPAVEAMAPAAAAPTPVHH
ncbi:hypothetical protein ACFC34_36985 [Streptomyces sp. NPDC056053]|uniref:hypothetical protein n=1 Tax=Streptomyces sp. NPDC056053 TaxID=3345696 RepID=UPI0035E16B37